MQKKAKATVGKKTVLELEILELEKKLSPGSSDPCKTTQIPGGSYVYNGAEC